MTKPICLTLSLLLGVFASTAADAAQNRPRDRDRDAVLRAYELQNLNQRQNFSQPFDSPFRVGPQSRPMQPSGSGSVVVPNR